jgi:hypothetical protein
MQHLHLGASLSAVIAATFHRHGKIIGTAKRAHKEGNQHRNQRLNPLHKATRLHIGAARLLRGHDFIRFFQQSRNKPQRNRHHHGNFMHLYMKHLERL